MNTIDILRRGAGRLVLETHLTPDQCAEVARWHDERDAALNRAEQYMAERDAARSALYEIDRRLGHDDADNEMREIISAALADKE